MEEVGFLQTMPMLVHGECGTYGVRAVNPGGVTAVGRRVSVLLNFACSRHVSMNGMLPDGGLMLVRDVGREGRLTLNSVLIPRVTLGTRATVPVTGRAIPRGSRLFRECRSLHRGVPVFGAG